MSEKSIKTTKKYYDYVSVGNRTAQMAYFVQQHDKNRMFEELLKTLQNMQIIVLVKSKRNADEIMRYLNTKEIKSISVHGNHRVAQIEDAQKSFNSKETKILITTDRILEKLTPMEVHVVVNYDLPLEASDYFKALLLVDEIGQSISLIDPEDEGMLATIELMMKCEMAEVEMKHFEHTARETTTPKERINKPRHKKVEQRAKKKAEIKSKWVPSK
ncbi:Superfamily II DNA and RNA helicases-like protein [Sulfurimonas denitrificans DSM 1251]|uniref:Superfamily II DNA and RNA helicases-like protein n=1 Tax=Sulfurimonas denitrificans (strain ATCC 33889 / DSM 1251) TaxID=326298 RepID=Q30RF7_SULDN|nr:helicase-related protein [Sulfurimonas denitrificans]ABB44424.1 Superfamily II DNA and RNA helicases-like protein [Sulfurimonas denitrificans DSM 1251]MDD3442961.1 helicase-related protein [Sulfurimonas denitrificans]